MSFPYKVGDFVIIDEEEDEIPVQGIYKYQVAYVNEDGNFLVYTPELCGWQIDAYHKDKYPTLPLGTWVWWFNTSAFSSLCHAIIRIDTVD